MSFARSIHRRALREKKGLGAVRRETAKSDTDHVRAAMTDSKSVRRVVKRLGLATATKLMRAEHERRQGERGTIRPGAGS